MKKKKKLKIENQQRQKEIEMNVEYVKKNKKWISKEIVETIGQQKKKNDNLVNHEIFGQKNDILQKIEARKNRACSLPHQILEARKMDNYRFKNGQTKQEKLRI